MSGDGGQYASERGVSMIELVIGVGIGVVVAVLAVSVMRISFQTQGTVTGSARASSQGEVVGDLIDSAVRPASKIRISDGGVRLDIQRTTACETFAISGSQLYRRTVTGAATGAVDPATWTNLLTWQTAAPLAVVPIPNADGTTKPYFAALRSDTGVAYNLRLTAADPRVGGQDLRVDIASTVMQRATGGGGPTCF